MAEAQKPQNEDMTSATGKGANGAQSAGEQGKQAGSKGQGGEDAIALLTADHRKVDELVASFEKARTRAQKSKSALSICNELKVHAMLEEEIFYPALREEAEDDSMLDEAQVEHDSLKLLIADIEGADATAPFFEAKVKVLGEYVKHHVGEEEGPSGIFAQARKAKLDIQALGARISQRKQELMERPEQLRAEPVSLQNSSSMKKESTMRNNSNGSRGGPGRDDQGRFMSDRDDDRRSRSSSRYDDDDDDRGRRSGRGRDDDDDGRGHGRGGWFGDFRGHSEAASRGWDDRDRGGSSRSSGRYDDDDDRGGRGGGRSSRGRDDDDDGRGHGRGGWFGDSQGHSEASRRGWEDRDRGGSSRSGRGRDDDDRSRSYSSGRGGRDEYDDERSRGGSSRSGSRYDDDDDRRNGRGGWFGDPRGHSEAARRGWEDRR